MLDSVEKTNPEISTLPQGAFNQWKVQEYKIMQIVRKTCYVEEINCKCKK